MLTDWSTDGRYLTYYSTDLGGGALFALPLTGTGERKPIEIFRSKFQLTGPRLSPDDRFVSYVSNATGRTELYIRPFNPNAAPGAAPSAGPWKLSEQGCLGMAFWRRDGKELFYLSPDRNLMVVQVSTNRTFQSGAAKALFQLPLGSSAWDVTPDGKRFLVAAPLAQSGPSPFVVVMNWQVELK